MGGSQPKPKPIDPRDQIEEAILNLRMTAKSFEHSANRAERDQKKEIDRAKLVSYNSLDSLLRQRNINPGP